MFLLFVFSDKVPSLNIIRPARVPFCVVFPSFDSRNVVSLLLHMISIFSMKKKNQIYLNVCSFGMKETAIKIYCVLHPSFLFLSNYIKY